MLLAFSTIDWWIVGIYVLLAASPGFLVRKYVRGQADFLVAGRTLSIFLATATLTATEMGLITVMYWSEFGYTMGFSAMIMGVIAFVATLFVGMTGFMVKGLRASRATTVAEYYQIRFTRGVRILGGVIVAVAGILNYGLFLRIEAEFIQIITGVPDLIVQTTAPGSTPETIPSVTLVMSVLVVIVLAYTLLGGMVSVAITDYIQFIVLTIGLGATTYWVLSHPDVGGFGGMVGAVEDYRQQDGVVYGLDPFARVKGPGGAILGLGALWVIWQLMHWLGTNTWQPGAFRTAASDSPRTARIMWSLTAFNYFGRGVIPMIWGIGALAFISHTMGAQAVSSFDASGHTMKAMPTFLSGLPTGLVGLLMAGMLAALMSTHSSYLLTWSGVLTEDLLAPLVSLTGRELPQSWRIWITRLLIVLLGGFLIWWGLWYEVQGTIWGYLAVTGTMYVAGAMTVLALGLYWRRSNTFGAYCGLIGGAFPGLVYLSLRIGVLLTGLGQSIPRMADLGLRLLGQLSKGEFLEAAGLFSLVAFDGWMTDPRTGVMSFVLAPVFMILGSLLTGGNQSAGAPVRAVKPSPTATASADPEGAVS